MYLKNKIILKDFPKCLQIIIEKDNIIIAGEKFDKQKLLEKMKGGKNGNKSNL
jgi:hypothetical protein